MLGTVAKLPNHSTAANILHRQRAKYKTVNQAFQPSGHLVESIARGDICLLTRRCLHFSLPADDVDRWSSLSRGPPGGPRGWGGVPLGDLGGRWGGVPLGSLCQRDWPSVQARTDRREGPM